MKENQMKAIYERMAQSILKKIDAMSPEKKRETAVFLKEILSRPSTSMSSGALTSMSSGALDDKRKTQHN